jgi:hypothetical protein
MFLVIVVSQCVSMDGSLMAQFFGEPSAVWHAHLQFGVPICIQAHADIIAHSVCFIVCFVHLVNPPLNKPLCCCSDC